MGKFVQTRKNYVNYDHQGVGFVTRLLHTHHRFGTPLTLLERDTTELPLTTQTALLSLNRSSLYYRPVAPSPQEVALKHRIDAIFTARPYYGVRRITAPLRRDGVLVNHQAVARHMHEMGLAGICPGPNLSKRAHQAGIYPSIPIGCAM